MHEKTIADIDQYGLSVILVEATDYLPSFAYSIGLAQRWGHPEIICFGLTIDNLHLVINEVANLVKTGVTMQLNKAYNDFFNNARSAFLNVDPQNLSDYFGAAIDYYSGIHFSALQLVWTDRNDKFPWETDFDQALLYIQPLLDRNTGFKFREPANLAAFTTRQWLEEDKPVLRVVHDHDADWQFLTDDQEPEDIRVVALEQLILKDSTLNAVFDLDYGEGAEREFIGGPWTRYQVEKEEADAE